MESIVFFWGFLEQIQKFTDVKMERLLAETGLTHCLFNLMKSLASSLSDTPVASDYLRLTMLGYT